MHTKVLPKGSRKLLAALEKMHSPLLEDWTLAGGTGLALCKGHRISEDFAFFHTGTWDLTRLHDIFKTLKPYETLQESEHTLTVIIQGVKVSFFQIKERFLFDRGKYSFFFIADPRDIALMKLVAISSRGSRKDFVDLYTILRSGPNLQDYFKLLPKKYGKERINTYHILKSLTFFADAEKEPLPVMLAPFDWKECKDFFVRQAQSIVLPP